MKRKAAIAAVVLVLVMLFTQFAFAGELKVVGTAPKNGEKGKQAANFAFKIQFDDKMTDKSNDASNKLHIVITDANKIIQSYEIMHHEKYPNELWLVLDDTLQSNTEYIVKVGDGIKSDNGNVTVDSQTFTFKTRNVSTDSTISVFLSLGMIVVIVLVSSKASKSAAEANSKPKKQINEKNAADPYKLAKEKNISVSEAKAIIAKDKEKQERKNASSVKAQQKKAEKDAEFEAAVQKRVQELHDESVFKVKRSGSMKSRGKAIPKAIQKKMNASKKKKK